MQRVKSNECLLFLYERTGIGQQHDAGSFGLGPVIHSHPERT